MVNVKNMYRDINDRAVANMQSALGRAFKKMLAIGDRTDRQLVCELTGISYAQSYRSTHANVGTQARQHKLTRAKRREHIELSPKYSNVGKLSNRLFA